MMLGGGNKMKGQSSLYATNTLNGWQIVGTEDYVTKLMNEIHEMCQDPQ